jgi:bilirubin oxidase
LAQSPLYIPPTLTGPVYTLNMQHGTHQFIPGVTSNTMGFNGNVLGPTLILQKGQQISMDVTNSIGEETTVHWHGLHVSAENDGGPHTVIEPNASWTPSFKVLDQAATYWYHPHLHDSTHKHVVRGLSGMIIVKDSQEATLNIPRTYGVDDFPLIVQTKAIELPSGIIRTGVGLGANGQDQNRDSNLIVNATKRPYINAPRQVIRLRLLNAAPQRVFNFGLSNNANFYQIASDGGFLPYMVAIKRLKLSPGERAEILVDLTSFTVGSILRLMSYASELPAGTWGASETWTANPSLGTTSPSSAPGYHPNYMNGTNFDILEMRVVAQTSSPVTTLPVFVPLAPDTRIPAAQATRTRVKYLIAGGSGGLFISKSPTATTAQPFRIFDMNFINDTVQLNTTEIWEINGSSQMYHPFHIHDIQFFILDRRDSLGNIIPLTPNEQGRKDVMFVGPREKVRFITKFDDFWGDIPYMYHCHITVHEDKGMMNQFIVNSSLYVDRFYGGTENGGFNTPYNTLREAVNAAVEGSTIYMKSAATHEELSSPLIILKKIKIKTLSGQVIVQ